jgi:hypothetical protein
MKACPNSSCRFHFEVPAEVIQEGVLLYKDDRQETQMVHLEVHPDPMSPSVRYCEACRGNRP